MVKLICKVNYVAPYVGAWIETVVPKYFVLSQIVAPYVGAWIETRARAERTRM